MPKKSNKLKPSEVKEKKPVKTTKVKAKTKKPTSLTFDYKFQQVLGFFLLLVSVYIFLSFSSFFVNWFDANTQTETGGSITNYFRDHAQQIENWTGKLGSIIANFLVLKGVGLGAYFISVLLFAIGLKLLINVKMFKLWTWFQLLTISLLWLPMLANIIFSEHPENVFGGLAGHQLNLWVINYIGKIGLIFTLVFVPMVFILIDYQFTFKTKKKDKSIDKPIKSTQTPKEDLYNTIEFSVDDEDDMDIVEKKDEKPSNSFKIELDPSLEKAKEEKTPEKKK